MSLEQRLTEDMKDAMRAKDEIRLSVIRMIRGQILLEKKKSTGVTEVPDDVVVALVRGHVKRLKETSEGDEAQSADRSGADDQDVLHREALVGQIVNRPLRIDVVVDRVDHHQRVGDERSDDRDCAHDGAARR